MAKQFLATLEHGKTYYCGETLFKHGVPAKVSQKVKEYLEKEAVDTLTLGDGTKKKPFLLQKFNFKEIVEDEPVVSTVPEVKEVSPEIGGLNQEDRDRIREQRKMKRLQASLD